MTIKRQYSLPNCKLILEGVGEEDSTGLAATARPPISVVVNAECHLIGIEKPLTGGREFLDSLVAAVSQYAQEYLSGLRHPMESHGKPGLVQLHRINNTAHRLTVYPDAPTRESAVGSAEPLQLELNTGQLFDLVEAVDQLCADPQTLPDLTFHVAPISRRYIASQEPIAKRAVPAALGVSSLAIAAGLFFLIPVPQVRRPEPAANGVNPENVESSPVASASPGPTGASPPDAIAAGSVSTPTAPVEASPDATVSPSPAASASAPSSPASEPDPSAVASTTPITDPTQLTGLKQRLRSTLDEAWKTRPSFEQNLVYRVAVAENGDVLGFRYVNDDAVRYVNQTPLLDLRYTPTATASPEPVAEFRVVFTPNGIVEVSPWHGEVPSPSP
jgi:Domain of unknown function (DUF4335)